MKNWNRSPRTPVTVSLALAVMVVCGLCLPTTAAQNTAVTDVPVGRMIQQSLNQADAGAKLQSPLDNLLRLRRDHWQTWWDCWVGWDGTRSKICPLGDTTAGRTIVAYGDSHMGMWLPALDALGRQTHFRVIPLIKLGCSPFEVDQLFKGNTPYSSCPGFRDWAVLKIGRIHPRLVVVTGRAFWALDPPPGTSYSDYWRHGVTTAANRLARRAGRVVVLGDISSPIEVIPSSCASDPDFTMASCESDVVQKATNANAAAIRGAEEAGVGYAPTLSLVCRSGRCPLVIDHLVAYHDRGHISKSWSLRAAHDLGVRVGLLP